MDKVRQALEVLLVEDSSTDAELCIRTLRKRGVANNIRWLKDGAEALEFLFGPEADKQAEPLPRLILLDLHLPKVSGLEVLARIKSNERTRSVPVVVLTSSKEDRDLTESYGLGVNSYVAKPVAFDAFVEIVSQTGLYWLVVNQACHQTPGLTDVTQPER
jgi:CheY-like chemotaxis protein